jgi:hypothetical protein
MKRLIYPKSLVSELKKAWVPSTLLSGKCQDLSPPPLPFLIVGEGVPAIIQVSPPSMEGDNGEGKG